MGHMVSHEQKEIRHRYARAVPVFLIFLVALPFVLSGVLFLERSPDRQAIEDGVEVQDASSVADSTSSPQADSTSSPQADSTSSPQADSENNTPSDSQEHTPLPDEVRGIYWTAYTAGSNRGQELLKYMQETGLNTAVIDLKMDNGELAFVPHDESLAVYAMNMYRIARIPVMRDGAFARAHPELAMHAIGGGLWQDNIGSFWIDPAGPEVADYAIALGREAYARGFDEVQFDYVRFASDGSINHIVYPVYDGEESKVNVMQSFFKRVGSAMRESGIPISFDLFGMTYWSYDDYNIGQRLVDVFPYSDWTSAMVYPSHYPNGFRGLSNPAEHPYWIVKESMEQGVDRVAGVYAGSEREVRQKFRPWLQDFDIGAVYTSDMIEAQIQAARDAGVSGWILWNARNVYEHANY
jgi:hypothetical protein